MRGSSAPTAQQLHAGGSLSENRSKLVNELLDEADVDPKRHRENSGTDLELVFEDTNR